MNVLDVVVVSGAIGAAIGGWRLGFLRRIGGWLGAAVGLVLGVVLLPTLVESLHLRDDRAIFLFGGAFIVLLATAGQAIGAAIGSRMRSGVDSSGGQYLDSLGGSLLGIVGVAVIAWLVFPIMAGARGWPSHAARSSTLTRQLSEALPSPPAQIGALERELAGGRFPKLFEGMAPAPSIEAPPPQVDMADGVYDHAMRSVVRIESPACGKVQTGSGFFVGNGRVMTNAHVVAGTHDTTVTGVDGDRSSAEVVYFDPAADLALLAVDSKVPPLPIAEPRTGDQGLVMGFPGGGPFDPSPFAVAERVRATGYDIYDRDRVNRELLVLASDLAPGDSGSAVLRSDGAVVGAAVAVAPDQPSVAYALDSSEMQRVLANAGDPTPKNTGPCR